MGGRDWGFRCAPSLSHYQDDATGGIIYKGERKRKTWGSVSRPAPLPLGTPGKRNGSVVSLLNGMLARQRGGGDKDSWGKERGILKKKEEMLIRNSEKEGLWATSSLLYGKGKLVSHLMFVR